MLSFVLFLVNKLRESGSELFKKVGDTFHKWRYEIANAFTKDAKQNKYSNSIAECTNNQLKTIIKSAYGYHNFERFRKPRNANHHILQKTIEKGHGIIRVLYAQFISQFCIAAF